MRVVSPFLLILTTRLFAPDLSAGAPRIFTNHIGYEVQGPKRAVVQGSEGDGIVGFYDYTNSPGGICNGITSGLDDEHDIDFNLPYSKTGKDHDWRWSGQWLPNASWYLLAVTAR